jgi:predicted ester cyclase
MKSRRIDSVCAAVAALNEGNLPGSLQYFDRSCPRWVAGVAEPLSLDNVKNSSLNLREAFDDLYLHTEMIFGNEDTVCARWRMTGRHVGPYLDIAPTGREINLEVCEIYRFSGELITETWNYGSPMQIFAQLGTDVPGEAR